MSSGQEETTISWYERRGLSFDILFTERQALTVSDKFEIQNVFPGSAVLYLQKLSLQSMFPGSQGKLRKHRIFELLKGNAMEAKVAFLEMHQKLHSWTYIRRSQHVIFNAFQGPGKLVFRK